MRGALGRLWVTPYVEYVVGCRGRNFGKRLARSPTAGLVED